MGKENSEICGGRTEEQGCANRQRSRGIACWTKFLRGGRVGRGWKTAPGNRGSVKVQIQRSDCSCRHARRISRCGRLCPCSADGEVSGEQIDSTDRAHCRRKRRRTAGERARRRERSGQN